ncbi:hypothetical protein D1AOALGA4SA_5759 [Olavius algarvensis Delta 1 endosymbiont]|nr:hypothetical protein D1AOALGA4SA_5759 [Olavius algarvensis Delta 1 endosymbiont]
MKGNLEKNELLETLRLLESGEGTGVLCLTNSSQEIKIYFEQGDILHITGNIQEARLEHLLIRKKLFSTERIKELLRIARKENQPLLQLLVAEKLATLATLEKLIARLAGDVILKALSWPNGTYEFKSKPMDSRLVAKIRYNCRQLVQDIANEAKGPLAAEQTPEDESSRICGPSLKNTIIQKMKELPPTLQTVVKANKILAGEDTDFEALQRVLETDQSLVARILKIANSPYYGMSGKISSLQHAIRMLGLKTLSQLITLAGTGDFLNRHLKGYGISAREARDHSLVVGFGSRSLAALINPAVEDDAFIAGLLHDAGKIMLDPFIAERQSSSKDDVQDLGVDFEKRELGCDHAEIAADVFAQWRFPAFVVDAIRYHHTPDRIGDNELAYTIHAVDILSKVGRNDMPIYEISSVLNDDVSDFLGVGQEDIAAVFNEMKELEKNIFVN